MKHILFNDTIRVSQFTDEEKKDLKSTSTLPFGEDIMKSLGMIGRLPHYNRGKELRQVQRSNRYLAIQESRIARAIEEGNIKKAVFIWICLLKISRSYQILLFNRCCKGWYWKWSSLRAEETLFSAINKIRSWDLTLLINRFYIEKKNGKLRPIGAPNYESRMISKAFTDIIYAVTEKDRSAEQHGYMKKRGAWSAVLSCVRKLKEGFDGYEFDLKSFFNTVEPFIIMRKLEEVNKQLAISVSTIIKNIEYRFEKLEPEAELKPKAGRRNTIERFGVPQGLSLSPLLSTWALEYYGRPENMVMYADDGIYFFKNHMSRFHRWIERMAYAGIEIAPEKSKMIGQRFKFCGVEIDRDTEMCYFYETVNGKVMESKCSWKNEDVLESWLKTINNKYYKKLGWTWEINPDSFITMRDLGLSNMDKVRIYYESIVKGKMWKGYRKFIGISGIFDVFSSSSWSCNEILKIVKYKEANLAKIKPFVMTAKNLPAFSYAPALKGRYKHYYDNGKEKVRGMDKRYFEIMQFHNLKRATVRTKFS
jgi:hypothetical protein